MKFIAQIEFDPDTVESAGKNLRRVAIADLSRQIANHILHCVDSAIEIEIAKHCGFRWEPIGDLKVMPGDRLRYRVVLDVRDAKND